MNENKHKINPNFFWGFNVEIIDMIKEKFKQINYFDTKKNCKLILDLFKLFSFLYFLRTLKTYALCKVSNFYDVNGLLPFLQGDSFYQFFFLPIFSNMKFYEGPLRLLGFSLQSKNFFLQHFNLETFFNFLLNNVSILKYL